jgi:hypothetical protein
MLLYQDKTPRHGNVQSTWHFEIKHVGFPLIHMLDAAPSLLSSFSLTPFSLQCPDNNSPLLLQSLCMYLQLPTF